MWDEAIYLLRTTGKRKPQIHPGGHSKALTFSLDEAMSIALSSRCRQEKVTMNSAANAAVLWAVNHQLYGGKALPMRTWTFADLHPYLEPPPAPASLGCYIAMLRYTMPVSSGQDFWQFARQLNQKIYRSFKSGDKFSAALVSEMLLKLFTRLNRLRMGATALSYAGVVYFDQKENSLQVLGIHGYLSAINLSPEYSAMAHIFHDQLVMDVVYLDSDMDAETAQAIANEIQHILVEACAPSASQGLTSGLDPGV
jgi:hypothetical protein